MLRGPKNASLQDVRVYEYEDENGVLYWSFTPPETLIPVALRLRSRSRIGTHLINFIVSLRHVAAAFSKASSDG